MYNEPFTSDVILQIVFLVIWQAFYLWIGHLVMTKVGMLFVDAEIMRAGNEQLLNQLEEGVIILQKETK